MYNKMIIETLLGVLTLKLRSCQRDDLSGIGFYSKNNTANITLSQNAERRPIEFRTGARSIQIRSIHALKYHRTCQRGTL